MPRHSIPDVSPTEVLKLAGAKLGNYRLERLLGRGRMGVVYLARDEALLRQTAVKILSWQLKDKNAYDPEDWFLAEARSVARINHPNVVQIYGVARQGTYCYIAMEYVRGGSVHTEVANNGPFAALRATEILIQTARALQAAHGAGIIHRDIKPENLLLTAEGEAKLGDFGMALHASTPRTVGTARAGTPYYTAPEIWLGQEATPKTDLYALGATYYYLLTGRVPFGANDLQSLIQAHLHAAIPSPSDSDAKVSAACGRIIQQCLAKSPRERFADCRALAASAENLLLGLRTDSDGRRRKPSRQIPARDAEEPATVVSATSPEASGVGAGPSDEAEPFRRIYTGEPFRKHEELLVNWLESQPAHTMVLLGESESGRTTLAMGLARRQATHGAGIYFDGSSNKSLGGVSGVLRQSVDALSVERSCANDAAANLLAWLARAPRHTGQPLLLVLDTNLEQRSLYDKVAILTRERAVSEGWKVLVIDAIEQRGQWGAFVQATSSGAVAISQVARLTFEQSLGCAQSLVEAARSTIAPGFMLTPDAYLLAAHRANGNLGQLVRLIRGLLKRAREDRALGVSSWDVWCAHMESGAIDAPEAEARCRIPRPEVWPTHPVMEILNHHRNSFGIAPRRR